MGEVWNIQCALCLKLSNLEVAQEGSTVEDFVEEAINPIIKVNLNEGAAASFMDSDEVLLSEGAASVWHILHANLLILCNAELKSLLAWVGTIRAERRCLSEALR